MWLVHVRVWRGRRRKRERTHGFVSFSHEGCVEWRFCPSVGERGKGGVVDVISDTWTLRFVFGDDDWALILKHNGFWLGEITVKWRRRCCLTLTSCVYREREKRWKLAWQFYVMLGLGLGLEGIRGNLVHLLYLVKHWD